MNKKITKADEHARSLITSAIFAVIMFGMSVYDYSIYSDTGSFRVSNKMHVIWPSLSGQGEFILHLTLLSLFVIMFIFSFMKLRNETRKNT